MDWGCEELAQPNGPSASVSEGEAQKADDAAQVCSEENPAAGLPATVGI